MRCSSTNRIEYTSSRYDVVDARVVVGTLTVVVGKYFSFRRVLIGSKCAEVWNAPGTKTIVGLPSYMPALESSMLRAQELHFLLEIDRPNAKGCLLQRSSER